MEKYKNKKNYFEGWYFKQNNEIINIAFIPSISITNKEKKCFIQVIANDFSHTFEFPYSFFTYDQNELTITINNNSFSRKGIKVNLHDNDYDIEAEFSYKDLTPLKKDIMGPFSSFPFMECKHGIISMKHNVNGHLRINDDYYSFENCNGYIEKDFGSSFPTNYLWIQCNNFANNLCLFFSKATIPYLFFKFKGLICSILFDNKEYRFATYNFSKITLDEKNHIRLKKRKNILDIYYVQEKALELKAPTKGEMTRIINESLVSVCYVKLMVKNKILFEGIGKPAGIEIEKNPN